MANSLERRTKLKVSTKPCVFVVVEGNFTAVLQTESKTLSILLCECSDTTFFSSESLKYVWAKSQTQNVNLTWQQNAS